MSESGAVGSEQARTYVGLPIISSGFETAAGVRGLTNIGFLVKTVICSLFNKSFNYIQINFKVGLIGYELPVLY